MNVYLSCGEACDDLPLPSALFKGAVCTSLFEEEVVTEKEKDETLTRNRYDVDSLSSSFHYDRVLISLLCLLTSSHFLTVNRIEWLSYLYNINPSLTLPLHIRMEVSKEDLYLQHTKTLYTTGEDVRAEDSLSLINDAERVGEVLVNEGRRRLSVILKSMESSSKYAHLISALDAGRLISIAVPAFIVIPRLVNANYSLL